MNLAKTRRTPSSDKSNKEGYVSWLVYLSPWVDVKKVTGEAFEENYVRRFYKDFI